MSDAFWQAIGPVLVAIVGGPLVLLVSRSDKKPADTPPDAPATAVSAERSADIQQFGPTGTDRSPRYQPS